MGMDMRVLIEGEMYKLRLEREDFWIKTLRTVYPYGLNEKTKKMNKLAPVGTLFHKLPRQGERKHVTVRRNKEITLKNQPLNKILDVIGASPIKQRANVLRKTLNTLSIKELKQIAKEADAELKNNPSNINMK